MTKVSVIIPVYNVEKYIEKCLDSLVNQTLKDIEIIVVNDGSPDNSQKIIDKYVKKYPNIVKSYIKKNGGQGSARNYGLKKATGEYIGYVDSDDYVSIDMYEKMYNKAKKDKSDIVICQNYIDNDGKITIDSEEFVNIHDNRVFFGKMAVWNKIYKKEILVNNKINFKERVWYEDLAFTLKSIINSKNISFVDEPLYYYLIRPGSTMNNSNVEKNLEILDAFSDIISYLDRKKCFDLYYDRIEFLAVYHIYISGIVRVLRCKADNKNKKVVIDKFIGYINQWFPSYNKNKYLYLLDKNKKIIYNLLRLKLYLLIKLIFNIKEKLQ